MLLINASSSPFTPQQIGNTIIHAHRTPPFFPNNHKHGVVAQRVAKLNLAWIHPITTLEGLRHFVANLSIKCFTKNFAICAITPSTESTNKEKDALGFKFIPALTLYQVVLLLSI